MINMQMDIFHLWCNKKKKKLSGQLGSQDMKKEAGVWVCAEVYQKAVFVCVFMRTIPGASCCPQG